MGMDMARVPGGRVWVWVESFHPRRLVVGGGLCGCAGCRSRTREAFAVG